MTWAWSIALPPRPKLVLMALADIADDLGVCWPSQPTLAAKCSMADRTLRRVLSTLQAQELLFIDPRFQKDGSRTSNRYRLAISTPQDNLAGEPRTPVSGAPGHRWPGALATVGLVTTTEPSIEPSQPLQPAPQRTIGPAPPGGGGGDLIYSKGLTPTQREALRKRFAVLAHDQAQQVLDELSGRMAIAQVNNPIGYCAALIESMQRGEFSPELALQVGDARQAEAARRAELARIKQSLVIESRSEPREIPIQFREAFERLRRRSSALPKKDN